jgi:hypothetical protein
MVERFVIVLRFVQNGRVALIVRLAALILCPPLLAYAYGTICSNLWYGISLAYAPIAGGLIGLISRAMLDAAADRADPRYEFSGKGGIIGSSAAFFIAFAFAPKHADRIAILAIFFASSLFYYAIGKTGCLFLGCCRAMESRAARVPLPAIEAASSVALSIVAILTLLADTGLKLWSFPAIIAAFLVLRIFSRRTRGSSLRDAFAQPDSVALMVLACCAIVPIVVHQKF